MKLLSLCFIVGRPHKKYTIVKKENKKPIYGKPEGFFKSFFFMFSTCLMLSPPHFNSSRWPSSNNQAGGSSDISQKLFRIYLMQFLVCHLQKNCRFQEQLLSFFMEDVFGQLQLKICREIRFVEELHSLRQQLSRCVSTPSKYGDVEPRNLPRNQHVGIFLNIEG